MVIIYLNKYLWKETSSCILFSPLVFGLLVSVEDVAAGLVVDDGAVVRRVGVVGAAGGEGGEVDGVLLVVVVHVLQPLVALAVGGGERVGRQRLLADVLGKPHALGLDGSGVVDRLSVVNGGGVVNWGRVVNWGSVKWRSMVNWRGMVNWPRCVVGEGVDR